MVIALDASSVVASVWAMMLTAMIARMIGRIRVSKLEHLCTEREEICNSKT